MARSGTAAQSRPAMPRADEAAVKQEDYRFPTWWFYFMTAQNFPNMIFEGCLWGIIVPQVRLLPASAPSSSPARAGHRRHLRLR